MKTYQCLFLFVSTLLLACSGLGWHERRIPRSFDEMATSGTANWDAVREALLDCRDRTYRLDLGTRKQVFAVVKADAPREIIALIREIAGAQSAEGRLDDALAISFALSWLSRHNHPDAGPIAAEHLDSSDTWVLMETFAVLRESRHWTATEKVEEVLRRIPQDARDLVPNVNGLQFLVASPATGPEVCDLRSPGLDAYCAAQIGTSKPLACEDFEEAWRELNQRFGCAPAAAAGAS